MQTDHKPRAGGRPRGSTSALSPARHLALMQELKQGQGPVNLAALAKAYGISRNTLARYVDEEPGLKQRIEERRAASGQGYIQVKRGTRATRAASKQEFIAARGNRVDPPLPAGIAAALQRSLDDMDGEPRFMAEMNGEEYTPPNSRVELGTTVGETFDGYRVIDLFPAPRDKIDKF